MREAAAASSTGTALGVTPSALAQHWSSGSTAQCKPDAAAGTSRVIVHGPAADLAATASARDLVAAVVCAPTKTRVGVVAMTGSRRARGASYRWRDRPQSGSVRLLGQIDEARE